MTTLAAIVTKDALVMGCDSLGTVTKAFLDPFDLLDFFDASNGYRLKTDGDGRPLLPDWGALYRRSEEVPYNQMSHVAKLFSMDPLPIGVMFTGITSVGDRTIRSLIGEFCETDNAFSATGSRRNYTVRSVGERLLAFFRRHYSAAYPNQYDQPFLELIMGGYDKNRPTPCVWRLRVDQDRLSDTFGGTGYGIVFGGQRDWIQRIVFGTDTTNQVLLSERSWSLLNDYHQLVTDDLVAKGVTGYHVPPPDQFGPRLRMFENWDVQGLDADWGNFSEQNAIECVDFFVNIMIKSQQFSSRLPTVGGDVHVAVVRKTGFRFVSREVWRHGDHSVEVPAVLRGGL